MHRLFKFINAGGAASQLTFTFIVAETMDRGAISIEMPVGWSSPKTPRERRIHDCYFLDTQIVTVVYDDGGGVSKGGRSNYRTGKYRYRRINDMASRSSRRADQWRNRAKEECNGDINKFTKGKTISIIERGHNNGKKNQENKRS